MRNSKVVLISGYFNPGWRVRLALWLVSSVLLSLFFFREFWVSLPGMISPSRVLGQNQASPWGVLVLCFIFLWLKRKQVREQMGDTLGMVFIPVGLTLIAVALLMPFSTDYRMFQVLLVVLGGFILFFVGAARIPSILLAVYGFAISFPLLIERFAEGPYSQTVITPLGELLTTLGYTFKSDGQWLHFVSFSGEPISVVVTVGCAGPATMGVFLSIFTLMMLDMPLLAKRAVGLFLFGVIGTWLQSFIRLVILMLAGYHLGEQALWTAHFWTIYLLFPLWYLFFAYIYFREFGRQKRVAELAVTAGDGREG
ncbi:MAG: archaeosortase/exosortase family protein [Chloroflexi bacterium]|nr:archaeosortase/exosortase family protein [Chloroflexota bacterium]